MTDEEKNGIWSELEKKSPDLIKVFLSLKNEDELKAFFRDLMSERDLREFAMRWEVAKKLDALLTKASSRPKRSTVPVTSPGKASISRRSACRQAAVPGLKVFSSATRALAASDA
jgi:uncharacterized protein YerC